MQRKAKTQNDIAVETMRREQREGVQPLPASVREHLGRQLQAFFATGGEHAPLRLTGLVARLERTLARRPTEPAYREALLAAVPTLRAFAISLAGNVDRAEDLVQETILRAWDYSDRFEPGTNLGAWLMTILRNSFHSAYRKRRREVEDVDGQFAASLRTGPSQMDRLQVLELEQALAQLPPKHREALILIGAEGRSYEEVAHICGCSLGTVKSRVSRARARLADLMRLDADGLATDSVMHAAMRPR